MTERATVAYFLMRAENRAQTLDVRAEDQQGPGPGPDGSATGSGQASRSETRGRSATREGALFGPARASGRASTRPFPPFTPNDPRSLLCHDERQRQHLARYKVRGGLWPPFLKDNFQPHQRGIKAYREAYQDSKRGMAPVFTASGQGTLWVGDMNVATDFPTIAANHIRRRMSCSGWGVTRSPGVWNVPVFDVEDLLRGRVHFSLLWYTLRDLDQLLETGKSVLLFCEKW